MHTLLKIVGASFVLSLPLAGSAVAAAAPDCNTTGPLVIVIPAQNKAVLQYERKADQMSRILVCTRKHSDEPWTLEYTSTDLAAQSAYTDFWEKHGAALPYELKIVSVAQNGTTFDEFGDIQFAKIRDHDREIKFFTHKGDAEPSTSVWIKFGA